MGSLSLLQGNFLTQESNWGLLHYKQILYQLSYEGALIKRQYFHSVVNILIPGIVGRGEFGGIVTSDSHKTSSVCPGHWALCCSLLHAS